MARRRNIKPGFFKNEELSAFPAMTRLLFAGLWTIADKSGRLEDRPRRIKAQVLPYDDVTAEQIDGMLCELASGNKPFITRYIHDGSKLIQVVNWEAWQHNDPDYTPQTALSHFKTQLAGQLTRAFELGLEASLTVQEWGEVLEAFGWKCAYCSASEIHLTIDHLIPVSRGGGHCRENVVPACWSCNSRKRTKLPLVFIASREGFIRG